METKKPQKSKEKPAEAAPVAQEPSVKQPVTQKEPKQKKEVEEILWKPKTELGRKVKSGEITSIGQALAFGKRIMEPEITETLIPNLGSEFILVGQAHGKFGGGKRRLVKQTQRKAREGNKPSFTTMAVVGNEDGYVGVGVGTAKETVVAKDKSVRKAKLNLIEVIRGCGSWQCGCGDPHSLPFETEGKCSSVSVKLMPAPRGTGLVVEKELAKLLRLAGYKDLRSKTSGQTRTKMNTVKACVKALEKVAGMRLKDEHKKIFKKGSIN